MQRDLSADQHIDGTSDSSPIPAVRIRLLGTPQIERNGQVVDKLGSQKSVALLGYLAGHAGPISRSRLAGLLWIDQPEAEGRRNLRWALSNLTKHLAESLSATRHTVAFVAAPDTWLDTAVFESLLARGDSDSLTRAVALYRGDFMDGLALDDCPELELWLLQERETWRQKTIGALETLIDEHVAATRHYQAEQCLRRLLALEPWNEDAHCRLMWVLAVSGQRSAALAQFELCCQILASELDSDPLPETEALYEQIRRGEIAPIATNADSAEPLHSVSPSPAEERSMPQGFVAPPSKPALPRVDWGEVADSGPLYGRDAEVQQLHTWLLRDRCRLVTVCGIGGQGKTALVTHVAHHLAEETGTNADNDADSHADNDGDNDADNDAPFARVIWRSVRGEPAPEEMLKSWLEFLTGGAAALPDSFDAQITMLLEALRRERCLLVLDNVESILAESDAAHHQDAGQSAPYRKGYEGYGRLFQRLGESRHNSCLLLTTREKPADIARMDRSGPHVRSLYLPGLDPEAGQTLLRAHGIEVTRSILHYLVQRYSGNPLALLLTAETIHELFDGDAVAFLGENALILDDVREMLDEQFSRLSRLEKDILCWAAIEQEPLSSAALYDRLLAPGSRRAVLEAVRQLTHRSLLQRVTEDARGEARTGFVLQSVVSEYAIGHLVDRMVDEIERGTPDFLHSHALLRAEAPTYVRQRQEWLLLKPVAHRLRNHLGDRVLTDRLHQLLQDLRALGQRVPSYAGGNLLNLLLALELDVSPFNFSSLSVWQANLQNVELHSVNFAAADLAGSVFADTFGGVVSLGVHPRREVIAAGTTEGEVRLWHAPALRPSSALRVHDNFVWSVEFSADGRILATCSDDGTITIRDGETYQAVRTLESGASGVWRIGLRHDGAQLASGGSDGAVCIWDVETGVLQHTWRTHESGVRGLAFSPDGRWLGSADSTGQILLWNAHTGEPVAWLRGHERAIWSLKFSPDGEWLASGSLDGTVRLWHVPGALHTENRAGADGAEIPVVRAAERLYGHADEVVTVAFNGAGTLLASGSIDHTVRLWDVRSGLALHTLQGHSAAVMAVAFSADDRTLFSGGTDHTVRAWDVRSGRALQSVHGYAFGATALDFTPAGTMLLGGSQDTKLRLWDATTGQPITAFAAHGGEILCTAYSPTGDLAASSSVDGTIRLWDTVTGEARRALHHHRYWVRAVAFHPDGTLLASASSDGRVGLWCVESGTLLHSLAHPGGVWSVAFSSDGQHLFAGCTDYSVHLWHVESREQRKVLTGHTNWVTCLAPTSDGHHLVSGSADGDLRLWQIADGRCVHQWRADAGWVWSVAAAFVPTGRERPVLTVASAHTDGAIRLWQENAAGAVQTLRGHTSWVRCVRFTHDGTRLASASMDGSVRIWTPATGECQHVLHLQGPYRGMNIAGATGLTDAQKISLQVLGAE